MARLAVFVACAAALHGCALLLDTSELSGSDASDGSLVEGGTDDRNVAAPDGSVDAGSGSIDEALLAHYTLDETSGNAVNDSSGRGNHAALVGDPAKVWGPGRIGNAFHGDGKTAYISVAKRPGALAIGYGDFTVALWAMVGAAFADGGQVAGIDRNEQWFFTLAYGQCCSKENYPSIRIGWWYRDFGVYLADRYDAGPDDAGDWGHAFGVAVDYNQAPGVWHHIAVTRREGLVALYIDGLNREARDSPFAVSLTHPSESFVFGRLGQYFLLGAIDDVRIYGRALAESEIGALHRAAN